MSNPTVLMLKRPPRTCKHKQIDYASRSPALLQDSEKSFHTELRFCLISATIAKSHHLRVFSNLLSQEKKQNRLSATKCNGLRDFCCLGFPVEPKKALCLAHFRHERCKVSENLFVLQKPKQSYEKVRRKLSGFHTEMTKNSRRC